MEPSSDDKVFKALRSALLDIFFTENIASYHVDSAAEILAGIDRRHIKIILELVRLIAYSVSEILAFSFIENVGYAIHLLDYQGLQDWVKAAIQIYESEGLQPAKDFLQNAGETTSSFGLSSEAAAFDQVSPHLLLLAVGLTGREVRFKNGTIPWTDTETIYAPRIWNKFNDKRLNELFFKVTVIHKCFQIANHSLLLPIEKVTAMFQSSTESHRRGDETRCPTGIEAFLQSLEPAAEQRDGASLFSLMETIRNEAAIARDYPGLYRDIGTLKGALCAMCNKGSPARLTGPLSILSWVTGHYAGQPNLGDSSLEQRILRLRQKEATALDSSVCTADLANAFPSFPWYEELKTGLPYIGTIFPKESAAALLRRRRECKKRFMEIVAALVAEQKRNPVSEDTEMALDKKSCPVCTDSDIEQAVAMVIASRPKPGESGGEIPEEVTTMKGPEMELQQELKSLLSEIEADMGDLPQSYVSAAADLATGSYALVETKPDDSGAPLQENFVYDEWDFRRQAYRKNWCSVKEQLSTPAAGDFIQNTLHTYRGQILMLKRQFEALRQDNKVLKRQKEGDDIDIEAVVEAHADFTAGTTPKENLFVRHHKAERNIAVAFLVDMSASTEGWTNRAIKESLVLLCESLEVLGDRYAIFGFSGMRRTSCRFYMIKEFNEGYTDNVKERITGISPKDYTRMGPAIRHTIFKFQDIEAKLKLLITLTDGKPEDYDEYKGPYAIEDTRAALIEAKNMGIRPFCITIDKEAQEYLPRLYGEVNYTLVQNVSNLHKRLPEMYRLLTT